MRKYLKAYEGVFNSAAIPVLVDAFDEAWKAVQDSGAANATEAARVALAKHIVDAALIGGAIIIGCVTTLCNTSLRYPRRRYEPGAQVP